MPTRREGDKEEKEGRPQRRKRREGHVLCRNYLVLIELNQ